MSSIDYEYCAHPTTFNQPLSPQLMYNGDGTWRYMPRIKIICAMCGEDLSDGLKPPKRMPLFDEMLKLKKLKKT